MTQHGHADKHAIIESDSTSVSGTDELMTNGKPTPIKNAIQVDEAKLNEYPAWQRAIRRKQLEAEAKSKIQAEIEERERIAKMAREAAELQNQLSELGIDVPDTAEIDTEGSQPVISFGGYRWQHVTERNRFGRGILIRKDVPDALRWDDMDSETLDYLMDTGYQDTVAEDVYTLSPEAIAKALDTLEEQVEYQKMKNGWVITEMEQRKANPPVEAQEVAEVTQPVVQTEAERLIDALKNPPKVEHQFFVTSIDDPEAAKKLKALTDAGWFIEYEQFDQHDSTPFYLARLERITDDTEPTGDDDPTATKEEEAEAEPDLSKFEAALLDIDDDELEAEEVGEPEGEPITYHEGTIVADEPKTALDMLLEGKPIAQAIFKYGLEETKQALNAAALSKVTGTPPTSLAELPEPVEHEVVDSYLVIEPEYIGDGFTEEYAS